MATRKRRVIEDDDSSDENRQVGEQVNEKEKNAATTSMVDRLKRRAARTAELANKRKKSSPTKSIDASKTPKKEQSIPKKPKKAQAIPKKSNDGKNGTKNEVDKVKKETPSLLSEMKKPPMPPTANINMSSSGGGKGNYNISKNKTRPFHSSWGTTNGNSVTPKQMPASPTGLSSPNVASTPPPPTTVNLVDISGLPDPVANGTKIEEKVGDKLGSGLRQIVLDGLRDLCKDAFESPPERNGVDLFASFLRHKDLKPTIQTNGNNNESFTNTLRYDFFDIDETTRTIVVQPKIPIFPEDFPAGGIREWPLSWWGIVSPSIEEKKEEEKAKLKIDTDPQIHSKSRRNRQGARSDSSKDGTGDLNRHDNSRSTRKRSSRDKYDDENAHYDDDPAWESHRNRFPVGVFDDGEGRYPPQSHGPAYDFDRNSQPPDGYHSNSRNSHHRGGGQPFPNRTRDGPPRAYPRDGPPPRDFRDGGRQYPAHGGSGPPSREYLHRDPYGPQGRGPPLRDDRRDHRDRSQRSPNLKMERGDGRHRSSSGKKR